MSGSSLPPEGSASPLPSRISDPQTSPFSQCVTRLCPANRYQSRNARPSGTVCGRSGPPHPFGVYEPTAPTEKRIEGLQREEVNAAYHCSGGKEILRPRPGPLQRIRCSDWFGGSWPERMKRHRHLLTTVAVSPRLPLVYIQPVPLAIEF